MDYQVLYAIGTFAVVAAIIAGVLLRSHRNGAKRQDVPSATQVSAPASTPSPKAPVDSTDFDPNATCMVPQLKLRAQSTSPQHARATGAALLHGHLVCMSGPNRGITYQVGASGIVVGRSAACDVQIDDGRVSSRHAWIGIVDGKAVVRDLNSTNGTFLNAQTSTPITESDLLSGDTIYFGGHLSEQYRFVAE
jgi:hypothetical protein